MEMHCKHAWYPLGLLCNCFRFPCGICRTFAQNSLCRMGLCCHMLLFVGPCHRCRAGPRVLIAFELFGIKRLYPPHGFFPAAPWAPHVPRAFAWESFRFSQASQLFFTVSWLALPRALRSTLVYLNFYPPFFVFRASKAPAGLIPPCCHSAFSGILHRFVACAALVA